MQVADKHDTQNNHHFSDEDSYHGEEELNADANEISKIKLNVDISRKFYRKLVKHFYKTDYIYIFPIFHWLRLETIILFITCTILYT